MVTGGGPGINYDYHRDRRDTFVLSSVPETGQTIDRAPARREYRNATFD